ncbi:hypothetical protein RYH80_08210 [Halobaculum sp. MBLA0147]|uniref:hypothetical protein n=1 Tax=Halobaculum sp. MBLA0147 TaxID=3079934 RepID=UPI0035260C70
MVSLTRTVRTLAVAVICLLVLTAVVSQANVVAAGAAVTGTATGEDTGAVATASVATLDPPSIRQRGDGALVVTLSNASHDTGSRVQVAVDGGDGEPVSYNVSGASAGDNTTRYVVTAADLPEFDATQAEVTVTQGDTPLATETLSLRYVRAVGARLSSTGGVVVNTTETAGLGGGPVTLSLTASGQTVTADARVVNGTLRVAPGAVRSFYYPPRNATVEAADATILDTSGALTASFGRLAGTVSATADGGTLTVSSPAVVPGTEYDVIVTTADGRYENVLVAGGSNGSGRVTVSSSTLAAATSATVTLRHAPSNATVIDAATVAPNAVATASVAAVDRANGTTTLDVSGVTPLSGSVTSVTVVGADESATVSTPTLTGDTLRLDGLVLETGAAYDVVVERADAPSITLAVGSGDRGAVTVPSTGGTAGLGEAGGVSPLMLGVGAAGLTLVVGSVAFVYVFGRRDAETPGRRQYSLAVAVRDAEGRTPDRSVTVTARRRPDVTGDGGLGDGATGGGGLADDEGLGGGGRSPGGQRGASGGQSSDPGSGRQSSGVGVGRQSSGAGTDRRSSGAGTTAGPTPSGGGETTQFQLLGGEGEIELPEGQWELDVGPETDGGPRTVWDGVEEPVVFRLSPLPATTTVVDETGRAVADAEVTLEAPAEARTRDTGHDGRVELGEVSQLATDLTLRVTHDSYETYETRLDSVRDLADEVTLTAARGDLVVTAPVDGAHTAGVHVEATPVTPDAVPGRETVAAETGDDGEVRFDDLVVGEYEVTVSVDGAEYEGSTTTVSVRPDERTTATAGVSFTYRLSASQRERIDDLAGSPREMLPPQRIDGGVHYYYGTVFESLAAVIEAVEESGARFVGTGLSPDAVVTELLDVGEATVDAVGVALNSKHNVDLFSACADMDAVRRSWADDADGGFALETLFAAAERTPRALNTELRERLDEAEALVAERQSEVTVVSPVKEPLEEVRSFADDELTPVPDHERQLALSVVLDGYLDALEATFDDDALRDRLDRTVY